MHGLPGREVQLSRLELLLGMPAWKIPAKLWERSVPRVFGQCGSSCHVMHLEPVPGGEIWLERIQLRFMLARQILDWSSRLHFLPGRILLLVSRSLELHPMFGGQIPESIGKVELRELRRGLVIGCERSKQRRGVCVLCGRIISTEFGGLDMHDLRCWHVFNCRCSFLSVVPCRPCQRRQRGGMLPVRGGFISAEFRSIELPRLLSRHVYSLYRGEPVLKLRSRKKQWRGCEGL